MLLINQLLPSKSFQRLAVLPVVSLDQTEQNQFAMEFGADVIYKLELRSCIMFSRADVPLRSELCAIGINFFRETISRVQIGVTARSDGYPPFYSLIAALFELRQRPRQDNSMC
jgi:hypothetical protein